jgi:3-methyladenine DNA glycosylase AlkD
MTAKEIIKQLEGLGQESIKKVLLKHDIKEPLFGVKVEELKKINKKVKNGHALSLELYDSGIYDAMYLAGLVAEPELMSKKEIQKWAKQANAPVLSEYTVAWVAAESKHGMELALEWIASKEAHIASSGWATLSNIVSITSDSDLDIARLKELMNSIPGAIDKSPNRVKATMNTFVIATGTYIQQLNATAKQIATKMGKVKVDVGDTACKIPSALEYIEKAEAKNAIGKKKKSARCL